MEHVAAFMLLVGCSGDLQTCQEIPTPVPAYVNIEQCHDDLPLQMRMSASSDRRILGACKAVDADTFEQSATIDWSVTRDGRLTVTFDAEPQVVAAR